MSQVVRLLSLVLVLTAGTISAFADSRVVTSNADGLAPGTLRQAVADANSGACVAPCTISFSLPDLVPPTITLDGSGLTIATNSVIIDGFSAGTPNSAPFPSPDNATRNITISGGVNCTGCIAFDVTASNVEIKGLIIDGFTFGHGIQLRGSSNLVRGNYVRNNSVGIGINSPAANSNLIGGSDPADRNIISLNDGPSASGGVVVSEGSFNVIDGNFIGVDPTGTAPEANFVGVFVNSNANNNEIGTGTGNLIAGNGRGIDALGVSTLIKNNLIGITGLGNSVFGVRIGGSGSNSSILNNSIRNNTDGVEVVAPAIGVVIQDNIMEGNGLGIDLVAFSNFDQGPTANDLTDSDSGGNGLQNYPEILAAYYDPVYDEVRIRFNLDSSGSPNASIDVELYEAEPSGANPAGIAFFGLQCGFGTKTFNNAEAVYFAPGLAVGDRVVMTATGRGDTFCGSGSPGDGTSEFSSPATLSLQPGIVTTTADSGPGSLRQAILDANSGACDSFGSCDIKFAIDPSLRGPDGTYTIRPLTPLPPITRSNVQIDGSTQSTFEGSDPNPLGPDIVINGSLLSGPAIGFEITPPVSGPTVQNVVINDLVINGFADHGILFRGNGSFTSDFHLIRSCYLGTNAAGTAAVPNGSAVTLGFQSSFISVGQTFIGEARLSARGLFGALGNVISGNAVGVTITDDTFGNQVVANKIGTDAAGLGALPNGVGISVGGTASNNQIGGTSFGEANTIAFNTAQGILISSPANVTEIVSNSIHSNGALGIDILPAGPDPNDSPDSGSQNYPVLDSRSEGGGMTNVTGNLTSEPVTEYRVQIFSSASPDPSGYGEGQTLVDDFLVTTDSAGNAPIARSFSGSHRWLAATATNNSTFATSEFSAVTNTPPDAVDDMATPTPSGSPVVTNVLANDTDADGDPFSITSFTSGANGTVACSGSTCTYTPNAGFVGSDTYTYTITDAGAATDTATVSVTITNQPPVAADDTGSTTPNTPVTINVLANDSDPELQPLTISGFTSGANGTVSCAAPNCTYTPNSGFVGTDTFNYTVTDAGGATDAAMVTVTVTNQSPTAVNDGGSTTSNAPVTINVLANDTDPEGHTLTITGFTQGANGTVSCSTPNCTYTPNSGFTGGDSFTYTISDGFGGSAAGTVMVAVNNQAPIAAPDTASTSSNTPVTTNVVANDSDPEGQPLTVTSFGPASNGTVSCSATACTYTPNANFIGSDSYTYTASDPGGLTDTETVTVTVSNQPPVAVNDSAATTSGTPVLTDVLANDSDPEGQPLVISTFTQGANGTVTCSTPKCTYTPNAAFTGIDSYTYTIQDSFGAMSTATVTVSVSTGNQPPVAVDDNASVTQGQSVTLNVLSNDTDPNGDVLTVISFSQGSQGSVSCSPSGSCTYTASANASGSDAFSYKISDGKGGFDEGLVAVTIGAACPSAPTLTSPSNQSTGVPTSGTLLWSGSNADLFEVFYGPAGQGCSMSQASTPNSALQYSGLQQDTEYEWRVVASRGNCPAVSSPCARFRTERTCTAAAPSPISPAAGANVSSPITFQWTGVSGATNYRLFATAGGSDVLLGQTTATSLVASVPDTASAWYVVAEGVPGCGTLRSVDTPFLVCNAPPPPLASVVSESTSGQTYTVSWEPVAGATRYEVVEALNPEFIDAVSFPTTELFMHFTKNDVTSATGFYYQVRAFTECFNGFGGASPIIRVVVVPVPPRETPNTTANAPVGSTKPIVLQVFVPGEPGQRFRFSAEGDQPWMLVIPSSGELGPEGITLDVHADPTNLPNGTVTGTVIVTLFELTNGRAATHSNHTRSTPVSINLVTPVTPTSPGPPTASSLIIPAVGHLAGSDAAWRSDVRVANTSNALSRYLLTFTPGSAAQGVKQTTIDVGPGETTALDDIIRSWYGVGSLGESSNGVLEVRPLNTGSNLTTNGELPSVSLTTVVSSRTYAQTQSGTLGEFIPGVSFSRFIGAATSGQARSVLNLQQIAQNQDYRTNVGVVEAAGAPVSALLSVFTSAGEKLTDIPIDLKAKEQKQLNSLLAQHNITLNDGRIEVHVTGGEGRVTAYAAVIDNRTKDQLFVPATTIGQIASSRYVMPGIADLNTGNALWRSDMRLFNSGATAQVATLTLHPLNNSGPPLTATVTVDANEVKVLDNVVQSLFGASNIGGAVHVATRNLSSLVVTARTYNQTPAGTLGLFIPAVTPDEAIGNDGRSLNLVQAEESVRYRTNLGIAEVTGNPVTVELMVHLPGGKASARIEMPLAGNEFRQINLLREIGLTNVYNARISMKVTGGGGRITAYGSVLDMKTNDSTYVPAR